MLMLEVALKEGEELGGKAGKGPSTPRRELGTPEVERHGRRTEAR